MSQAAGHFSTAELLESAGQAVIATDLDGVICYWNAAAERLYGWPAAEALHRNVADVVVPELSQQMAGEIMEALRTGRSWSGGFPVQDRSGRIFPALVTDSGIYRDGELVGILGISSHLGTALRPLLERSADAALVVTADGIVKYASPAVHPLFDWRPEELVGKAFAGLVHPGDQELLDDALRHPSQVLEVRLQGADGWLSAEVALTNLLDDPVVRGVVCNLHRSERLARLQERDRISQSVHADILQLLYSAALEIDALVPSVSEPQRSRVDAAAAALFDAIGTLRRIVQAD